MKRKMKPARGLAIPSEVVIQQETSLLTEYTGVRQVFGLYAVLLALLIVIGKLAMEPNRAGADGVNVIHES